MSTYTDNINAETAVVADIARESQRFNARINSNDGDVRVDIVRSDERVVNHSFEEYADVPHRPRGGATVASVDSFATLLAMEEHRGAVIFADERRTALTAVVNFHGWRDHRVTLALSLSDQFERWKHTSGNLLRQANFAEFIEDNLADIVDPTGADMLELAQSFQATKSVDFESGTRIASGAVRFRFVEQVDAKAGRAGDLEVPSTFVLGLPIWRGGPRIELRAALRYRIERDGLYLGFKVLAIDEVLRDAFAGAAAAVEERLDADHGHTLVFGPAPDAVSALA
ncbi:DUF2303 family protein [Nocardia acidivorans]|uniref:DUF2303 family protein n=1 Tax=Nocardia acidivorans TaxID=404580 RepID=UPI00082AC5A0|nr:DUF2303 family protein [Nocardia acidivorans]